MHLISKNRTCIVKNRLLIKKPNFLNKHFQTTFSCSISQKHIEEEIKRATEQIDFKKKSKKKRIGSVLLLVFNFLVIAGIFVYFSLTSGIKHISDLFAENIRWKFLGLAVLSLVLTIVLESIRYAQLIHKSTGKFRLGLATKTHMLGRYYDSITPFAVGGQPFQIFYLNKHDIKGDIATSIPLFKNVVSVSAFLIISLVVIIWNLISPFTDSIAITIIAIIGFILNGAIIFLILLLSISKKVGPALIIKILKLLNKLHIIKNYKVTFFRVSRFVKSYQKSIKIFAKSASTFVLQVFLGIIFYIFNYSIVYFIYLAFNTVYSVSILEIFACMTLCDLCSGIMPLPGGSGAAEISFDTLFGRWFVGGILPWALLVWRILSYFVYIIVGGIQIFCSFIKNNFLKKKDK